MVDYRLVRGDILDQSVDVIVNSWNRNVFPWWLLLPQGVSGAIKRRAGLEPFREVFRFGPIPLGEARITGAGKLDFEAIIHVAGINLCWFATEYSVTASVRNAVQLVNEHEFESVAIPLIGSGSGNRGKAWSRELILRTLDGLESQARVLVVEF